MAHQTLRFFRYGVIVALAVVLPTAAGCESPQAIRFHVASVTLVAVSNEALAPGAPPAPAEAAPLPASEVPDVHVTVGGRADTVRTEGGEQRDTFGVHFVVTNVGGKPFVLDPCVAYILDDVGRKVTGCEGYVGPQPIKSMVIPAGATREFQLAFVLPPTVRLENTGSLRLFWPYRYGDKSFTGTAKFVRDVKLVGERSALEAGGGREPPYSGWSGSAGPMTPSSYGYGYGPYATAPGMGEYERR